MALTGRRIALDEFLALPEEKPALEYADGVVTPKVSPKFRHVRIQSTFTERVNNYAEPRELALAFPEPRATFGGRSYVPDVGVYRWEHLPLAPDGTLEDDSSTPWDVAIEVVSPGQSRREVEEKCRWYVANGVEIALMIDPDHADIVRIDADGASVVLRGDDRIDLEAVLPGFVLTPTELFATLRPGRRARR